MLFSKRILNTRSSPDIASELRTCLKERPLELIKGIGSDYDAANLVVKVRIGLSADYAIIQPTGQINVRNWLLWVLMSG